MIAMDAIMSLVEKTAYLKAFPVFGAVPTEALAMLAARARESKNSSASVATMEKARPRYRAARSSFHIRLRL